jgi:hypothetical protein
MAFLIIDGLGLFEFQIGDIVKMINMVAEHLVRGAQNKACKGATQGRSPLIAKTVYKRFGKTKIRRFRNQPYLLKNGGWNRT